MYVEMITTRFTKQKTIRGFTSVYIFPERNVAMQPENDLTITGSEYFMYRILPKENKYIRNA